MTLVDYYQQQCQEGLIQSDSAQIKALSHFQSLYNNLITNHKKSTSWLRLRKPKPTKGLYVWGGVGIGKTHLMDCFYEQVPFPEKMRLHFHAFMRLVHSELLNYRGQTNPVKLVAKQLAKKYKLICFDEFHVTEVVDAMILARLLEALIDNGVCFVATSNTAPDELYKHGLQRISFLPAIDLLNKHTDVVHLDSKQDYRLLQVKKTGVFFSPDDNVAYGKMNELFSMLAHGYVTNEDPLNIHGRWINVRKRAEKVVWFDFNDICNVPRSQQDFLALVEKYEIFFISHVPDIPATNRNVLTLFVKMIDVFYDSRTPLFFSSSVPVDQMCRDVDSFPEYVRTQSRLLEMQSEKYLANRL